MSNLDREIVALLRAYQKAHRYERTRITYNLAKATMRLRREFDNGGYGQAYRHHLRDLYDRAGIEPADRNTVASAVRYHVKQITDRRAA